MLKVLAKFLVKLFVSHLLIFLRLYSVLTVFFVPKAPKNRDRAHKWVWHCLNTIMSFRKFWTKLLANLCFENFWIFLKFCLLFQIFAPQNPHKKSSQVFEKGVASDKFTFTV